MSEIKWTIPQKAAIWDRGGALLVSAAAGSGKTAVLTERAVRLITDTEHPVEADRLLILTFTNAAAAELRARIGDALLQCSRKDPSDIRLNRQRLLLQRAPIETIDAFCLNLLHRFFSALDIPPDFTTADSGSIRMLRETALSETLEEACKDKDFCAFADLYGKSRSDETTGETILNLYDFLRSLPDYDREADNFLEPWQEENGFAQTQWRKLLLNEVGQRAEAAEKLLEEALRDCRLDFTDECRKAEDGKKTPSAKEKAVAKVKEKFHEPLERLDSSVTAARQAAELAENGQWDALSSFLSPYRGENPVAFGLKGMKKRLSGEHKTEVKFRADAGSALFGKLSDLVCCTEEEAEEDRARALPAVRALFRAVRDFDRRFWEKKRERKLLEFSDFEHLSLRLLREPDGTPTALCREIRAGYDAVMVDEYQDTNGLQDALYRCLASPSGDNRFLVGDLKQSIYRFRQADPGIFREKLEGWNPLPEAVARPRPAEGEAGKEARLALDANFRSAPNVVDGINFFFERLMTPTLGDTGYGDGQRLVCGAPTEYAGSVTAYLFREKEDAVREDAEWIAEQIETMVRQKEEVRSGTGTRPIRYEDCCILLSARKNFPRYAEALEKRGIPVYSDSSEDLLDAPHIRPLIALLRIIDNPAQDIYLVAAMLGPLFGFTEDDLVRLRAIQKKGSLYGAILFVAENGGEDGFTHKIRLFLARLNALRQLSHSLPVERLLEEIFISTGYLAALGAMENGARRREDAHRFVSFCVAHGAGGISALVRSIEATEAAGGYQDSVPSGIHAGCVTVMTIHRSKGLEFPAVFVADTGHRFNTDDLRRPVLFHRSLGVGLRFRSQGGEGGIGGNGLYKTASYTAIEAAHGREMRSEQMRLLYVAMTRAKDKLFLTVPLPAKDPDKALAEVAVWYSAGAQNTLHEQGMSFAEWLRAALMVHPDAGELRRFADGTNLSPVAVSGKIEVILKTDVTEEAEETVVRQETEPTEPDGKLTQALLEGFEWQYPAQALSAIPAKVSVTSVVHKREQTTLDRPSFLYKEGLTAAEMGTALHAFLEHADFGRMSHAKREGREALREAIRAERERQVREKLTAPEIAEKLDERRILRFLESEAFVRVENARTVLREYEFITSLPAQTVLDAQGGQSEKTALTEQARVLVQGVADLVLEYPDHLELLDYKTDHHKTPEEFIRTYRAQLELYALAIEKRFAPKKITYKGIYSFALGQLIEVKNGGEK